MTDFLDRYAAQFRAAAAAQGRRRARLALVPLAVAGAAAAAVAVNVVATRPEKPVGEVETARPVTGAGGGGYAEQRELLGVLRDPTKRDRDRQVRQTLRDYRELGPRAGRLLGKAPSGSAYVLLATRFYNHTELRDREPVTTRRRDGLCLVRRGTQGGSGTCLGTAAVRAGDFHGAMGGEVFGVVPDGVTQVRPPRRDRPVRVRRNFYSYPAHGHPGAPPVWLDAEGNEVAREYPPGRFAHLVGGGHTSLEFPGAVAVVGLWASWCDPCIEQLRRLKTFDDDFSRRGLVVVAVAMRDRTAAAREVVERLGIRFPVLEDPRGELERTYGVKAFPETIVLAPDGSVAARHRGPVDVEELRRSVDAASP